MAVKIRIDFFSNAKDKINGAISSVDALKKKTDASSKAMKQNWKDVAAAIGIAILAVNKLKQFFTGLIKTYEAQIQAETKLQGALKATGHAAGLSYVELEKMAQGLADVTNFADEAALEAEALLVTFTKIGGEIFPDALEAAADMSTMFGQDLKQSVIQLGTALNDPIAGIGRLKRIGISFTQDQRDMIEGFVEMNDIMGAQAVILDELQNEFGGVARAMGQNALGALKQLNNGFIDMQEKAGEAFLEGVEPLIGAMQDFVDFMGENVKVFTIIGESIAFFGKIIISVIKFVIRFKEAIIAYLVVAVGLPGVIILAVKAFMLLKAVLLADPLALIIAGIVAAIAAIVNLVKKANEAAAAFRAFKKESEDLASGLLKDAASGAIKEMGKLQAALGSLNSQLEELDNQTNAANDRQLDQILELIGVYDDLRKRIEKQIEVRKEIQLLEDAQSQNLKVYSDYAKALDVIDGKMEEFQDTIAQVIALRKKQAELTGTEYDPPDVSELEKGLAVWEKLSDEILDTAGEVLKYGANFKEVLEKRASLEADFNDKFFKLVSDRITIITTEKELAIKEAEEVGAEVANINAYYNELIRRENEKTAESRRKFEEQYVKKYNDLTLSRVELLEIERENALAIAEEKGASLFLVEKYYAELITRTRQEENQNALEDEKKMLADLEAEYKAHADARKRFQEDVVNYITGLSNQWLLSESEVLKKQRDEEISNVEDIAATWREQIGYIVDSAGQVSLSMEPPEDFADTLLDMQLTQEEINAYAEEYNQKLKEAEAAEIKIGQAHAAVTEEFLEQISAAERQESLARIVGGSYLDSYGILQGITAEMRSQEDVQRSAIKSQITGLSQLISSVQTNMSVAGIAADDIINSLPYLDIITNANEAIIYLQEELGKIPTEADKAFLELSEKVGSISKKYLDPLEKKKQVLEEEFRQTSEYLVLLKEQHKVQIEHLDTLEFGSKVYQDELNALVSTAAVVQEVEDLANDISGQISAIDTEVQQGGDGEAITDYLSAAMEGLGEVVIWLVEQLIQLVSSTEAWQKYMEDFNALLVNLMESAVIPLLDALQPVVLILIEVVSVIVTLLVPVFKILGALITGMMPLFLALGNIIVQAVGIFQALFPVIALIAQLASAILAPVIAAVSESLGFLGNLVSDLAPVFDALGYVTDALGRVFNTLWQIIGFLASPFQALGEMLYYLVTFQWDKLSGISIVSPQQLMDELSDIWSAPWEGNQFQQFAIDPNDIPTIEMSAEDVNQIDPTGIGASIYGGNVSIQQAPDIYFYQTFQGPVIGAGGMQEVGGFVVEAIQEYVGSGGKVEFIEGEG